jgi:hypothetical protein
MSRNKSIVWDNYGLDDSFAAIHSLEEDESHNREETWRVIDAYVSQTADIVIPISVRKSGMMEHCLRSAERRGATILRDFEILHHSKKEHVSYSLDPQTLSIEARQYHDNTLIHWTRTSRGPWPDERPVDYYRDLVSNQSYPRTAFDTLVRILTTQTIMASGNHITGSEPVVAFSSLHPVDVVPLMTWRARYQQMSFEPYGIGIVSSVGNHLGIRPVQYIEQKLRHASVEDRWLTQSVGKRTDWRRESEYRHKGDLPLRQIERASLCVFVRTTDEARIINDRFGLKTTAMISNAESQFGQSGGTAPPLNM